MRSKKRKWRKRANTAKAYAERLEQQATEGIARVEGLSHEGRPTKHSHRTNEI